MPQRANHQLHVAIATPFGRGGHGGIDRLMWQVADTIDKLDSSVRLHMLVTRGRGHILVSVYWMLRALATVLCLRATGRIDILHVNLARKGSTYRKIVLCSFARMCGVPYAIHLHDGMYGDYWAKAGPALSRWIGRMFAGARCVIVLGSVWRNFVIGQNAALSSRVVVLPNASPSIRRPRLPNDDGHVRILFLGKLAEQKGVFQLVEALGRLSQLPNWRATLAGDADYNAGDGDVKQTSDAIAARGLSDRVEMPGWIEPAEVEGLVSHADILVLPSLCEGLPMSVIEGMAAGLAVVATPVGAVEDIIEHERTGLLVPPGDVTALANAIRRLIADPALREALGREARRFHHANLEIPSYVNRLCQTWRDAVHGDLNVQVTALTVPMGLVRSVPDASRAAGIADGHA
jgi:glycosyltransferase involved in cell wall biosynthesis